MRLGKTEPLSTKPLSALDSNDLFVHSYFTANFSDGTLSLPTLLLAEKNLSHTRFLDMQTA